MTDMLSMIGMLFFSLILLLLLNLLLPLKRPLNLSTTRETFQALRSLYFALAYLLERHQQIKSPALEKRPLSTAEIARLAHLIQRLSEELDDLIDRNQALIEPVLSSSVQDYLQAVQAYLTAWYSQPEENSLPVEHQLQQISHKLHHLWR